MLRRTRTPLVISIIALAVSAPEALAASQWNMVGTVEGASFGAAVALGDADGDGFDDLLVGSPLRGAGAGHVRLFRGGPEGYDVSASVPWQQSGGPGGGFGEVIVALGDVNGDGLADFAVGEPRRGADGSERGRVWLFGGTPDGLAELAHWDGTSDGERFGAALAGPGDVDGDGLADLLVGSPDASGGAGRVSLYAGTTGAFADDPSWGLQGAPGEHLGAVLVKVWDVNGDGRADFLVGGDDGVSLFVGEAGPGAHFEALVAPDEGGLGDLDGDGLADLTAASALGSPPVGAAWPSVRPASAGDFDGDGIPDAWSLTGDAKFPVAIVAGRDGSTLATPACPDCAAGAVRAASVAFGDVDGDGYADLAMGAADRSVEGLALGAVFVVRGGLPYAAAVERARWPVGPGALGTAGDRDGDGFDDLVTTASNGELVVRRGGVAPGATATPLGISARAHVAADLDGDGDAELAVAVDDAVQVLGLRAAPTWRFALAPGAQPGRWLASGDFDGDGAVDLLVGAAANLGRASVEAFWGSDAGPIETPSWESLGPPFEPGAPTLVAVGHVRGARRTDLIALDTVGRVRLLGDDLEDALSHPLDGAGGALAVDAAGDVDGDGFDDVIIRRADGSELWWGAAAGLTPTPAPLGTGAAVGVGDLDRDGRDDLVVVRGGTAQILWGARDFGAGLDIDGPVRAVVAAGDVDGDGGAELLVDDGDAVRLLSFLPSGRLNLAPRARELDGSRTLASEVATRARAAFAVDARSVPLFGGDAVALEVQVAPLGTPLAQGALTTSPLAAVAPGERVSIALSGLEDGTPYRYRARLRFPLAAAPTQVATPWVYGGVGPRRGVVLTRPLTPPTAWPDLITVDQGGVAGKPGPGVLANDVAAPGETLTAELVTEPRHGDLIFNDDGGYSYRPGHFWGHYEFRYRAIGDGGSSEAQVDIVVTPKGACRGRTEAPCRSGLFAVTLRRVDGSLVGLQCWRDGDTLACDQDEDGALRFTAPSCGVEDR